MGRPAKQTRENFESGKIDSWTAGGYGASVRVERVGGSLKIFWRDPATKKPRQRRLFSADSRELRREATATAVALSEGLRSGKVEEETSRPKTAEELTLEDVAALYMEGRIPGFKREMLDWTPSQVARHMAEQPEAVRQHAHAVDTLNKDLRSFRGVWQHARLARGRKVVEIEPSDWRTAQQDLLQKYSPRTLANWRDRLSVAVRDVMHSHRKSIGLLANPFDGAKAVRTKARIPRYTEEERAKLRAEAEKEMASGKHWRLWVLLGLAHSGRRVGSLLHLSAADHDFEAGTVRWRAEHAKGQNYGRGDDVRKMTALHRRVVEWTIEHHPNPAGPEHPLLWMKKDPTRPVNYAALVRDWHEMEAAAGVEQVRQRAFHSMRRAVVTLLSAKLGVEDAADFVGMTPATANEFFYRQATAEQMEKAAEAINEEIGA